MVCSQKENSDVEGEKLVVAAHLWPSCHDEKRNSEILWPERTGGWEVIKKGTPRFEGINSVTKYNWGGGEGVEDYITRAEQAMKRRENWDQTRLITLFSWNEWVEGGYLLPDMRWE